MPLKKTREIQLRRLAFARLHEQGWDRLKVQAELGVSRSDYFRLLKWYRDSRATRLQTA